MNATSFIYGFSSALVCVIGSLFAVYAHLKRTRRKKSNIQGYLDLIPDLTEQQKAQLQEIRRVFLPRVERIRQSMRNKRAQLAELLFAEPTDRDGIYAVSGEIIGHQSKLEHEVIEHILEEKEMLTPSQKRRFYEIIVEQFASGGLGVHDIKTKEKGRHPAAKQP